MIDSNLTDEKLVELIRSKDKEQYAEIINRYQDKLMRYARYLINDGNKAADVVQNTFIKAYINLYGFDTKKSFQAGFIALLIMKPLMKRKSITKNYLWITTLMHHQKNQLKRSSTEKKLLNMHTAA